MKLALKHTRGGGAVDHLIDALSGGLGFCHAELVFADGRFFSSDAPDGVRFKDRDPYPGRFVFYELAASPREESLALAFARTQVGRGYDWPGVFRFVPPFSRIPLKLSRRRWFCSEIVTVAMQRAGLMGHLDPRHVSPNSLFQICEGARFIRPYGF